MQLLINKHMAHSRTQTGAQTKHAKVQEGKKRRGGQDIKRSRESTEKAGQSSALSSQLGLIKVTVLICSPD